MDEKISSIYCIYRVTNTLNGKTYIGYHRLRNESLEADGYWGSGLVLRAAYKKYGKQNFKREILEKFNSHKEASEAEIRYIQIERENGHSEYNLDDGGTGGDLSKFKDHSKPCSEETRKKISEASKGTHWYNNGEKCIMARECPEGWVKGRLNRHWNINKKLSEEARKKISEAQKRYFSNPENRKKASEAQKRRKGLSESSKEKLSLIRKDRRAFNKYKHWYTDGTKSVFTFECPKGFHEGRLMKSNTEKRKESHKGLRWFTNGESNVMKRECPPGFWPGMTR